MANRSVYQQLLDARRPAFSRFNWFRRAEYQRYSPTTGRVPRDILRRAVKERKPVEYQLTAAAGAYLPIIYGKARVSPIIFMIGASQAESDTDLIFGAIWGAGEVESISIITPTGAAYPNAGSVFTHYTGTTGQTANNDLAQIDPNWASALVYTIGGDSMGVAYSVFRDTYILASPIAQPVGEVEGRKVYDPRTETTVYSENPALCLADFLCDPIVGAGRAVDWDSVEEAADACDEAMAGGDVRRRLGLVIDGRQTIETWAEILRAHAGCYIAYSGSSVSLTPDRPVSVPVASLTDADFIEDKGRHSLKFSVRDKDSTPTVVSVGFVDQRAQSELPIWGAGSSGWVYDFATVYADGVLAGTTEWRDDVFDMPGVPTYEQALREAKERLNSAQLEDISATWEADDEGIKFEVGDVVSITSARRSVVGKLFRIAKISSAGGRAYRWRVDATEYQAATYSNDVVSPDDVNDITFLDPSSPPTPSGLVATEEVYQLQTGLYASRVKLTWDSPNWPLVARYIVEFWDGTTLVHTSETGSLVYRSPAIKEGVTYSCRVRIVSVSGAEGSEGTTTIESAGKYLTPGDVPSFRGIELGGQVRLSWGPAADLDIFRYELRYGSTGGSWDTATLIDRVDGLRHVTQSIPEGTWRFYCKALDSVGLYSDNAATVDLDVTIDPNILASEEIFDAPVTTSNFESFVLGRTDPQSARYVTDAGTAAATLFPADPVGSNYPNVAATYHGASSCDWESETWDLGYLISGQWRGETGASALSGSLSANLRLSDDDVSYTDYPTLSAKVAAQYAKLRIQGASSGDTVLILVPDAKATLAAVTRDETGESTSLASGGKTITLDNDYIQAAVINITPKGTASRVGVVDNVSVGTPTTFDVYIFDSGGSQVAADFYWQFKGI